MLPISYHMKNRINGQNAVIKGDGHWYENGTMALNLKVSEPLPDRWSGIILPCICSGPGPGTGPGFVARTSEDETSAPSARVSGGLVSVAPNGYRTAPGTLRRATLWSDKGQIVAQVSATGIYKKSATELDFVIDVETETIDGDLLTKLNSIDHYAFTIVPSGTRNLQVTSQYSLSASDGRRVFGATDIMYEVIGASHSLKSPLVGFNSISLQQHGPLIQYVTEQHVHYKEALGISATIIAPLQDEGQT